MLVVRLIADFICIAANSIHPYLMNETQNWYIVKLPAGNCEIVAQAANNEATERWGPFESKQEAIARRVGLIRAGKCQPV